MAEYELGGGKFPDGKLIVKSLVWIVVAFFLLGGLLFGSAGRLDWQAGWIFMITLFGCVGINLVILLKTNPEVIEERSHFNRGAKKWDVVITSVATVFIVATVAVAGIDERYSWCGPLGLGWLCVGIIQFVVGDLFFLWAMTVNKYFSKLVRIQTERGHKVVTSGPYRIVRHPGYLGWSVMWIGTPLILDSLLAFIPAVLSIILMVVRTELEDNTLRRELPGYLEYVSRVGYKLVPWVW